MLLLFHLSKEDVSILLLATNFITLLKDTVFYVQFIICNNKESVFLFKMGIWFHLT